jgi:hypothetical protein
MREGFSHTSIKQKTMNLRASHRVGHVGDIPPVINQQKPAPRHLQFLSTRKYHRMSALRIRL